MFICLFFFTFLPPFFLLLFSLWPIHQPHHHLPFYSSFTCPHNWRPSCLNSVDSSVWCGVGSDDGDEVIKYIDEDGNPFVVACCRGDYCRNAQQHLTNHTLLSVAGLFLRSFPTKKVLSYILFTPVSPPALNNSLSFNFIIFRNFDLIPVDFRSSLIFFF
jgi:hypothetical protein